jgi:hypothetical protein
MSTSTALVPVVTVPARRDGHWWVVDVAEEGVWTRGRTLTEAGDRAHAAVALARGIDPGLIAVRVAVDCPELAALAEAREHERAALAAAVVQLRAQHVPWPETAAVLQVSQRAARDAWATAVS